MENERVFVVTWVSNGFLVEPKVHPNAEVVPDAANVFETHDALGAFFATKCPL